MSLCAPGAGAGEDFERRSGLAGKREAVEDGNRDVCNGVDNVKY
jgi:hypothetical protein